MPVSQAHCRKIIVMVKEDLILEKDKANAGVDLIKIINY